LAASCLGPLQSAAATDIDSLLQALARPLPAETAFVEQRGSELLDAPLLLRGRLSHPRPGVLVREVRSPYPEVTTVADGRVEIVRDGERRRRFSLRNAPELAALLAGFEGMVTGDRALLERHYALTLERDGERWLLTLTPRDPRSARRVRSLRLSGREAELLCTEVRQPDGGGSRMLVGPAATRAADRADAGDVIDPDLIDPDLIDPDVIDPNGVDDIFADACR